MDFYIPQVKPLTSEMIAEGELLAAAMLGAGMPVDVVFWVYDPENDKWYLYIRHAGASHGEGEYRKIDELRSLLRLEAIEPFSIVRHGDRYQGSQEQAKLMKRNRLIGSKEFDIEGIGGVYVYGRFGEKAK